MFRFDPEILHCTSNTCNLLNLQVVKELAAADRSPVATSKATTTSMATATRYRNKWRENTD